MIKYVDIDPNNVDALNNKGIILANQGNYTGAMDYFDKVLAIEPKNVGALINKGIILGK